MHNNTRQRASVREASDISRHSGALSAGDSTVIRSTVTAATADYTALQNTANYVPSSRPGCSQQGTSSKVTFIFYNVVHRSGSEISRSGVRYPAR